MSLIQVSPDVLPSIVTRMNNIECDLKSLREFSLKQTALIQSQTDEIKELKCLINNLLLRVSDVRIPADENVSKKQCECASKPAIQLHLPADVNRATRTPDPAQRLKKASNPEPPLPASDKSDDALTSQREARLLRRNERNKVTPTYAAVSVKSKTDMNLVADNEFEDTYLNDAEALVPAPQKEDNWREVRYKKPSRPLSRRCLAGPTVTSLKAVEPRKYFHLWNMLSSADEIKAYLNELCPQKAFTVEELKTANNYKSFKIGVPEECYEMLFSVNIWPDNARVKKWINYKKRSLDTESKTFLTEVGKGAVHPNA